MPDDIIKYPGNTEKYNTTDEPFVPAENTPVFKHPYKENRINSYIDIGINSIETILVSSKRAHQFIQKSNTA